MRMSSTFFMLLKLKLIEFSSFSFQHYYWLVSRRTKCDCLCVVMSVHIAVNRWLIMH